MSLENILSTVENNILHFNKLLQTDEYKDKMVCYFTADIPVEIISAAGLIPFRIPSDISSIESNPRKQSIDTLIQPFVCSKSRQMLDFIISQNEHFSGAVFSESYCDSLQNLVDILQMNNSLHESFHSFRFLLPVKRGKPTETKYYYEELKRLVGWLQDWTGKEISLDDISESIGLYNRKKQLLNELSDYMINSDRKQLVMSEFLKLKIGSDILPVKEGNNLLENALQSIKNLNEDNNKHRPSSTPRVLISGGMFDNSRIFDEIPTLNNAIVANDLSFGSRSATFLISNDHFEKNGKNRFDSLLWQIAKGYIQDRIPDSVHFPSEPRKKHLLDLIKKYKIDGIIFIYYGFCDPDTFESRNLTKFLDKTLSIPSITIETDPQLTNLGQLTTRVEAFLEKIGD